MKRQMDRKTLKYYSRMATECYVDDAVHSYVTKNVNIRKKFIYHFMIERLDTSSREDIIYFDEEARGICILRDAHNNYDLFDFLLCPNWVFLYFYWPLTIKTLIAYGHLDDKVFPEKTLLISPVFVDPKHQGQGIATKLIKKGIEEFVPKGYTIGLEAQNEKNKLYYEKLGFKVIKEEYWKRENVRNYYMIYENQQNS